MTLPLQGYEYIPTRDHEPWMDDADCTRVWWDELSDNNKKNVCYTCPVMRACQAYADRIEPVLDPGSYSDIMAGETPHERIRRRNVIRKRG